MKENYISIVCPHCGNEAARLRFGEESTASPSQPESVHLSPEEQIKARLISELDLSIRTENCIGYFRPAIMTVGDLIQHTEAELLRMGKKPVKEIKRVLEHMNLSLTQPPADRTDKPDSVSEA